MTAGRAALGFRVKSGWAISILIGGSARSPHLRESDAINLSDPRNPEMRQPYHAAMGMLETDTTKLKRRMQSVRQATENPLSIFSIGAPTMATRFVVPRSWLEA